MSFFFKYKDAIKKTLTYTGLFFVGDCAAQKVSQYMNCDCELSRPKIMVPTSRPIEQFLTYTNLDGEKLKFTLGWGIGGGVIVHNWYKWIDGTFKYSALGHWFNNLGYKYPKLGPLTRIHPIMGISTGLLIGKLIVDVAFDMPLYGAYMYSNKLYETRNMDNHLQLSTYSKPFTQEFATTFGKMYLMDMVFWIPFNYINFFYIRPQYRVLFFSCGTAIWAAALPLICRDKH